MSAPQENHTLHHAISDALESERQRLATRLRESVLDRANLIQAQLNAYQNTASGDQRMAFSVLSSLMQQLMQDIYALESDLNPQTLQMLGFIPALEAITAQQRRMTGVNFSLDIDRHAPRLPLQLELALFRWLQQTLNDALHTRSSTHISIAWQYADNQFTLTLDENGHGQPPEISLIDDRLHALGAQITHGSSRYSGLQIIIRIVIPEAVNLTERENQVIRLVAQGMTNKEIAYQLGIKPRTIKFHLDNIYSKLNVTTRTEAAIYALQNGLTD